MFYLINFADFVHRLYIPTSSLVLLAIDIISYHDKKSGFQMPFETQSFCQPNVFPPFEHSGARILNIFGIPIAALCLFFQWNSVYQWYQVLYKMVAEMEVWISNTKPMEILTSERSVFQCLVCQCLVLKPPMYQTCSVFVSPLYVSFYPNLARRRTIAQGHNYHAVGKSKNIILSSEAQVKGYCYKAIYNCYETIMFGRVT